MLKHFIPLAFTLPLISFLLLPPPGQNPLIHVVCARRRLQHLLYHRQAFVPLADRTFPVAAAIVWNSLPPQVTTSPSKRLRGCSWAYCHVTTSVLQAKHWLPILLSDPVQDCMRCLCTLHSLAGVRVRSTSKTWWNLSLVTPVDSN